MAVIPREHQLGFFQRAFLSVAVIKRIRVQLPITNPCRPLRCKLGRSNCSKYQPSCRLSFLSADRITGDIPYLQILEPTGSGCGICSCRPVPTSTRLPYAFYAIQVLSCIRRLMALIVVFMMAVRVMSMSHDAWCSWA